MVLGRWKFLFGKALVLEAMLVLGRVTSSIFWWILCLCGRGLVILSWGWNILHILPCICVGANYEICIIKHVFFFIPYKPIRIFFYVMGFGKNCFDWGQFVDGKVYRRYTDPLSHQTPSGKKWMAYDPHVSQAISGWTYRNYWFIMIYLYR